MKNLKLTILILSLFNSVEIFCQESSGVDFACANLENIDSLEFVLNKPKFTQISTSKLVEKSNNTFTIKTKDSTFVFADDLSDETYYEYSYLGEYPEYNWVLILGQDYNQNYYFMINMESSKIDSLVGFPWIFHNEIVAVEGSYADGSDLIEIWKIKNNQMVKTLSFSPKECVKRRVEEVFLKNGNLYIRDAYTALTVGYYKLNLN